MSLLAHWVGDLRRNSGEYQWGSGECRTMGLSDVAKHRIPPPTSFNFARRRVHTLALIESLCS